MYRPIKHADFPYKTSVFQVEHVEIVSENEDFPWFPLQKMWNLYESVIKTRGTSCPPVNQGNFSFHCLRFFREQSIPLDRGRNSCGKWQPRGSLRSESSAHGTRGGRVGYLAPADVFATRVTWLDFSVGFFATVKVGGCWFLNRKVWHGLIWLNYA